MLLWVAAVTWCAENNQQRGDVISYVICTYFWEHKKTPKRSLTSYILYAEHLKDTKDPELMMKRVEMFTLLCTWITIMQQIYQKMTVILTDWPRYCSHVETLELLLISDQWEVKTLNCDSLYSSRPSGWSFNESDLNTLRVRSQFRGRSWDSFSPPALALEIIRDYIWRPSSWLHTLLFLTTSPLAPPTDCGMIK